ncbi:MAG: type II toxin-antitoxin system VapC family toxin [Deltaproteobacteria bacterium]|nr:type II toxin-antitoxin system VapC family toxin [Deltaproteobacteria bacterium]
MNVYILDTSVAIAWYLEEAFSNAAQAWQERLLSGRIILIVPLLHYWEFANVLRTLVHRNEITEDLAQEIYDLHLDAPLERAEPDERTVLDTAFEYGATAYDAVYISLCLPRAIPLITAEKTTTAWVTKLRDRIEAVR